MNARMQYCFGNIGLQKREGEGEVVRYLCGREGDSPIACNGKTL